MKVSAAKKALFCETLVRGGSTAGAAQAIGVDRSTVFRWKAADPAFAEAWDTARDTKVDLVETTLYRMAMQKDIAAVIFFLKSHRPEVYNRRMQIAVGGDEENPLIVDHAHRIASDEPWVIMMPPNGRDQPEPETEAPTIEADDEAA
jgi:hypothetical protein